MMIDPTVDSIAHALNPWWETGWASKASEHPQRRILHGAILEALGRWSDRRAVVLVGPRQVGKTVLLKQLVDDLLVKGCPPQNILYFDFSDPRIPQKRHLSPGDVIEIGLDRVQAEWPRVWLFDEIGGAANWDRWLKSTVDAFRTRPAKIVVTDSAASVLTDSSRETGPGRWDEYRMETLTYRECLLLLAGGDGDIARVREQLPSPFERFLLAGGFPGYLRQFHETDFLWPRILDSLRQDIAEKVIQRELVDHGVDAQRARDLFVYLVQDSGAIFTTADRARDLAADARTIDEWLAILEGTRLLFRLPRFSGNPAARLRSKPKLYASDHGLVTAFSPVLHPLDDVQIRSRVFETVVYRHLREIVQRGIGHLAFYRPGDRLKQEVDFVLDTQDGLVLVEVTSGSKLREDKMNSLRRAGVALDARRRIFVYAGSFNGLQGDIECFPMEDFLLHFSAGPGGPG